MKDSHMRMDCSRCEHLLYIDLYQFLFKLLRLIDHFSNEKETGQS